MTIQSTSKRVTKSYITIYYLLYYNTAQVPRRVLIRGLTMIQRKIAHLGLIINYQLNCLNYVYKLPTHNQNHLNLSLRISPFPNGLEFNFFSNVPKEVDIVLGCLVSPRIAVSLNVKACEIFWRIQLYLDAFLYLHSECILASKYVHGMH